MELERCKVLDVADGGMAVLVAISNCEFEHCDADYWIFSDRRGLRPSPINLDFEPVVSPDHQFVYVGEVLSGPEGH